VRRLHGASKTPLAVAGILAVPLFFVGLMAFSLKFDQPSHDLTKKGAHALGDPTKSTVGTIYLCAFAVSGAVILAGVLAVPFRSRLATIVPAAAGIAASVLLLLPLDTWAAQHMQRYPFGVDNIPRSSPQDLFLRGEWEQNAQTTARQIGLVTIGLAIAAIAITVALEIRRRRGIEGPYVPPPPEIVGVPEVSPTVELELADSDLARGDRPGRWRWR
jgi:hypothetical protein